MTNPLTDKEDFALILRDDPSGIAQKTNEATDRVKAVWIRFFTLGVVAAVLISGCIGTALYLSTQLVISSNLLVAITALLVFAVAIAIFRIAKYSLGDSFLPVQGSYSAPKPLNLGAVTLLTSMTEEKALDLLRLTREEIATNPACLENAYNEANKRFKSMQEKLPPAFAIEVAKMASNYSLAYQTLSKVKEEG